MRRLLGALVLLTTVTALTACGSEDPPTASDPAPTETSSTSAATTSPTTTPPGTSETATDLPTTVPPSEQPTKSPPIDPSGVPFELVEIVSATAGGGQSTSTDAVPITSKAQARAFAATFSDDLAEDLTTALAKARRANGSVYAAVVGLGCDVPPGVVVAPTSRGYEITGSKIPNPTPECFAPVTSVAIVAITG